MACQKSIDAIGSTRWCWNEPPPSRVAVVETDDGGRSLVSCVPLNAQEEILAPRGFGLVVGENARRVRDWCYSKPQAKVFERSDSSWVSCCSKLCLQHANYYIDMMAEIEDEFSKLTSPTSDIESTERKDLKDMAHLVSRTVFNASCGRHNCDGEIMYRSDDGGAGNASTYNGQILSNILNLSQDTSSNAISDDAARLIKRIREACPAHVDEALLVTIWRIARLNVQILPLPFLPRTDILMYVCMYTTILYYFELPSWLFASHSPL